MNKIVCLAMLLWTCGASAAFYFAPFRVVYHELAPAIGETVYVAYSEYPRLSADGSAIIYRVNHSNALVAVHVMNFDGSNDRVVDLITNYTYREYVLNLDGSRQANLDGFSLRTGSTAPGVGTQRLAVYGPALNSPALSDDGNKVYFCVAADTAEFPGGAPVARGLYEINADGSGRRLIVSRGAAAAKIGLPANHDLRFDFGRASANANQLVFVAFIDPYQTTNAVMGVNRDGSDLHVISYVGTSIRDTAISRNGGTVVWDEYNGPVRAADFSGANQRVFIAANDPHGLPISLNESGTHLMEGEGRIYRTDGYVYGTNGLGVRTVLYLTGAVTGPVLTAGNVAVLAPSGQRGVFIGRSRPYGNQVCTFEFDPANNGGAPDIATHAVAPPYVQIGAASMATVSARVTFTGTNRGVGVVSFRDGRLDDTFYLSVPLFDNGTTGDTTAGDGQYANNTLQAIYNDPALVGPRALRFHAESTDANGLRHAAAREHSTFFVGSNAPSGGGPTLYPAPATQTIDGRRVIRLYGASFAPGHTNNVVTLSGYPLEILSAATNELVTELPGWIADGVYAVRAWNNGQVTEAVKYRSPGLPPPALQTLLSPPMSNSVSLSWSGQLRAKYSVLASANLTNWMNLTNGVPGESTNLNVNVDASAINGSAVFFKVLEEPGVLE